MKVFDGGLLRDVFVQFLSVFISCILAVPASNLFHVDCE